jgi:hypothetical protein
LANDKSTEIRSKQVIDGLAANAFRVVGVGHEIVIESFYLYPNFSNLQDGQVLEFNTDPDPSDDPNIRLIMNREVAIRLTNALLATLGVQRAPQQNAEQEQPVEEPVA